MLADVLEAAFEVAVELLVERRSRWTVRILGLSLVAAGVVVYLLTSLPEVVPGAIVAVGVLVTVVPWVTGRRSA